MSLMILAHPNFEQSIANKTIVEELKNSSIDLEIRNIHQLNPNYNIDINSEQEALLRHDLIILQYPMYWFNMPAILKAWFDQVFTYQFAYGSKGNKLKNKKLLPSLTIGQSEKNFKQDNSQFLIDSFLKSIKKSAEYSQMKYIDPVILYDIATVNGHTEHEIKEKAKAHSEKIKRVIQRNINANY
ncbi:NAD(P)H-dependent oxidoreductase [Xenorhabdus griffiniae]|uniref:NAD(P)H-dependent oxidoreductase n=1 Tax=Xenorhabdus griffiniae TaxID=351672 RepID=A0ABY9XFB0_9GAMM|nr:NAD(P)H-dependent oxidoreductase [Xenorhabdus griffiniae]MBD1229575.1 NAD(P)H-dependent oxidoreductase [Xenorhabdus griffiniae]MBE8589345.1 NAD(P)H-dependent oxidoreductase [Xenorhabdus griffiniae]WMV71612.1 NAD(P)H-dependent oxidoreductase [Xenorhabdus griffiniae]WNH01289.1 NAD(P)H-dependent oxidoreductase [Xenorhabdus griffiniae]